MSPPLTDRGRHWNSGPRVILRCALSPQAFTLLELVAVIAIIAILIAAVVPAFSQIARASNLTTSGALLVDQLASARQTALSRNRVVEVRFYKLPGELAGSAAAFRAFRLFLYDEKVLTAAPMAGVQKLKSGIVILDDQTFSTLLNTTSNSRTLFPLTDTIPGVSKPVTYQAFRFRANGGTDLDGSGAPGPDKWFLTLKNETDPVSGTLPAHNYLTAMIDPISGRIRTFRP